MSKYAALRRSGASQGSTDPAAALAVRRPERALRYGVFAKASDAAAGRRDARADLRKDSRPDHLEPRSPLAWQLWLSRATHTFRERAHREFLAAQVAAEPGIAELQRLRAELAEAEAAAQNSGERLESMPVEVPAAVVASLGPAEHFEEPEAIEARRREAHRRARQQAAAGADADAQRVRSLTAAVHRAAAELENLFSVARIRSERLREYTSRRAATYLHAYLKTVHRGGAAELPDTPTAADAAIEAPAWTTVPCPWTAPLRDQS